MVGSKAESMYSVCTLSRVRRMCGGWGHERAGAVDAAGWRARRTPCTELCMLLCDHLLRAACGSESYQARRADLLHAMLPLGAACLDGNQRICVSLTRPAHPNRGLFTPRLVPGAPTFCSPCPDQVHIHTSRQIESKCWCKCKREGQPDKLCTRVCAASTPQTECTRMTQQKGLLDKPA